MIFKKKESYRMQVGKAAEKLIQEMMEELGFIVWPFGYEYTLKQFANKNNLLTGQAGEFIRSIPDFLIIDKKTNHAYLIEVKYSKNGELDESRVADFPETHIVLVSPQGILIADNNYRMENPNKEDIFMYLTEIGPFKNRNKDIILKYVHKARELFR